jgi:predicted membrane protein
MISSLPFFIMPELFYSIIQVWFYMIEEKNRRENSFLRNILLFIITFIVPFTLLSFLYTSIGIKTFKKTQPKETLTAMERA